MKICKHFMLLLVILMQVSCSKHMVVEDSKGPSCSTLCKKHYQACLQTCDNSCFQCREEAYNDADERYRSYINEITVAGQYKIRSHKSERDPLQCRKVTCNCGADLSVCIQKCDGKIRKSLRVPSLCT